MLLRSIQVCKAFERGASPSVSQLKINEMTMDAQCGTKKNVRWGSEVEAHKINPKLE